MALRRSQRPIFSPAGGRARQVGAACRSASCRNGPAFPYRERQRAGPRWNPGAQNWRLGSGSLTLAVRKKRIQSISTMRALGRRSVWTRCCVGQTGREAGMEGRGHRTARPGVRQDRRRLLALIGPLAAVLAAGCSRASPFRAPPPPPTVAPTPTAASWGRLRELFPGLDGVTDAASVSIERRHRGFRVPDRSEVYTLVRQADGYAGDGVVLAALGSTVKLTETRVVGVPRDAMQQMVRRLVDAPLDERSYVPSQPATDSYPEIEVRVVLPGGRASFFTQSQGPANGPWGVEYAGRTFVVRDDTASAALTLIEGYLLGDLVRQKVREVENEELRRLQKP
jgi:hypothetical protein